MLNLNVLLGWGKTSIQHSSSPPLKFSCGFLKWQLISGHIGGAHCLWDYKLCLWSLFPSALCLDGGLAAASRTKSHKRENGVFNHIMTSESDKQLRKDVDTLILTSAHLSGNSGRKLKHLVYFKRVLVIRFHQTYRYCDLQMSFILLNIDQPTGSSSGKIPNQGKSLKPAGFLPSLWK